MFKTAVVRPPWRHDDDDNDDNDDDDDDDDDNDDENNYPRTGPRSFVKS